MLASTVELHRARGRCVSIALVCLWLRLADSFQERPSLICYFNSRCLALDLCFLMCWMPLSTVSLGFHHQHSFHQYSEDALLIVYEMTEVKQGLCVCQFAMRDCFCLFCCICLPCRSNLTVGGSGCASSVRMCLYSNNVCVCVCVCVRV